MVGFVDAVKMFFRRYVDFSGRSSRAELWWVQLFMLIVVILWFVLIGLTAGDLSAGSEPSAISMILTSLFMLFILATIIPSIALIVRRLHDIDKSGWWYFIGLIPLVGAIILLVFYCTKGTTGPNRFGEDPLGNNGTVFE